MGSPDDIKVLRSRLEQALTKVAALVAQNTAYLPIFERLEQEIEAISTKESSLQRARALAARQSATR